MKSLEYILSGSEQLTNCMSLSELNAFSQTIMNEFLHVVISIEGPLLFV
jgi:hypothetical protein